MATIISRSQLSHPDLAAAGGGALHTSIATIYSTLGDNDASRYSEQTSIADSTTVEIDHNFGATLDQLDILIYSGTGSSKTQVLDPIDAGWILAGKTGEESTVLEVTTPSSGGPHTFSVVIIDARTMPKAAYQLLANTPSNPVANSVKTWFDDNARGMIQDSAGGLQPLSFLGTFYTSSSGNLSVGINTLVRSNIAAVTLDTPSTIANYDILMVTDAGRNANTNNITIGRNGNTINGLAEDYVISENGGWVILVGDSTNTDWIVLATSQSASAESGTNYFENSSFESNATDGVAVSGSVSPTIGEEIAAPLYGTRSSKITSGAGTGIIDYNIGLIDNGVVDGQIVTQISAHLKTDSAVAAGDWTVGVYDTTAAAYVVAATDLQADTINIYRTPFVPLFVTADRYKLRVEFTDTTAGRILTADKLNMTPDSNSSLVAFEQKTNIVDNSVLGLTGQAGFSATLITGMSYADANGNYRFVFNFKYSQTGSTTCDLNVTGVSWSDNQAVAAQSESAFNKLGWAKVDSTNLIQVRFTTSETSVVVSGDVALDAKPDWFDDNLDDNKVNLLTQDVIQANVRGKWSIGTGSITSGVTADFDTEVTTNFQVIGTWANTNGSITIPANGTYTLRCSIQGSNMSNGASINFKVNGTNDGAIAITNGTNTDNVAQGSTTLTLSKGDLITVGSDTTISTVVQSTNTYLEIVRLPDYGAFDPIGFALATDTVYGLVKKGLWAHKQASGVASVGAVAGSAFSNLVDGMVYEYRVSGQNSANAGGVHGVESNITANVTALTNNYLANDTDASNESRGYFTHTAIFEASVSLNEVHWHITAVTPTSAYSLDAWLIERPDLVGTETTVYD